ncbi:MAG: hypothetical protein CUN55_07240 [Phototrophicales bacterium]|nr:MAG: hypothetical protein CUN55_07240 [Phototrophicales bacterium]
MRRLAFLLLLLMTCLLPLGKLFAQEDPNLQLGKIEFSEGSILRYPLKYELDDVSAEDTARIDARNGSFFIYLFTLAERDTYNLETPTDAIQYIADGVDGFVIDASEAIPVETNGVTVMWLRYEDGNFPGTLQAVELPNGSIVVIDAYGAFYNSEYEAVALAMLSDMVLDNTSFMFDTRNVPPVPFDPKPIEDEDIELATYEFSNGSQLRYPDTWEPNDDFERRDYIVFKQETATFYVDYFLASDLEELSLEDIVDVMENSYQPIDENSDPFQRDEVQTFIVDGHTLYYWQYDDQGSPGTVLAVEKEDGSVLVIDAYNVHPGSANLDYAVAIALDFVGVSDLLEGKPLTSSSFSGLGELFNNPVQDE